MSAELQVEPGPGAGRPHVSGKWLAVNGRTLDVRGVTYGPFAPDEDDRGYPDRALVARDFAAMRAAGINAVRTYGAPPRWLLDLALEHGLWVAAGVAWTQHITFLDDRERTRTIEREVRAEVRAIGDHPALLCVVIGNEIPAGIVRWHGAAAIERFLRRLYRAVKEEAPGTIVTYVNYPTTEYLDLSFLDVLAFNVYLESPERFEAYLARLQTLAGDRPLLLMEIGLDSRSNGEEAQARAIDWQVRGGFAGGAAGTFVFAWTDQWHRGGHEILDWDFGLTARDRRPKPALAALTSAYGELPFPPDRSWPLVSVIVCSYNGERVIRDCLEALARLDYPRYEVIVVDDGSRDRTAEIARAFDVRLISTENRGLSNARNTGLESARGEIVAYVDDDAFPHPRWLLHLAETFRVTGAAAVGGPNIPPPDDGMIAACVAAAPGGPIHVLVSDTEAEHIPGCNMAFRTEALRAIGGFDPQLRIAGDDVDVCWRIQDAGGAIAFSPAAVVWHHRRDSVRRYWKQQAGYGRAEALLERKWPERYGATGHYAWAGRIYGAGLRPLLGVRSRIYHGSGGSAPFRSIYEPAPGVLSSLPLMPEWYLLLVALAAWCALGLLWRPLFLFAPLLGGALALTLAQAVAGGMRARLEESIPAGRQRLAYRALIAFLHLTQPLARLRGRLQFGLTFWRRRGPARPVLPRPRADAVWYEQWSAPEEHLAALRAALRAQRAIGAPGGDFDDWDLSVRGGLLGGARLVTAVEEHGSGRQLQRIRAWPSVGAFAAAVTAVPAVIGVLATLDGAWIAGGLMLAMAALVAVRACYECGIALAATQHAVAELARRAATIDATVASSAVGTAGRRELPAEVGTR